jgi:tetratricopeptide (TPR) repeat protein
MKSFKTALIMVLLLLSITVTLKAAEDFDILDMLPAFTGKVKCNFSGLEKTFKNYAVTAAAMVGQADKNLVTDFVSKYRDGGGPLKLVDNAQGGYDTIIFSRAAAFYLAGTQAVVQQNRVVAFWCFAEAASRNAHSAMFLNNAAFALIEFGYLDDALKALQCANFLAPDFISPYINLGKVLGSLGRWAEAAENYNTGFQKFANNPHYLWRAANAYKNAKKLSQAWNLGNVGNSAFPGVYDWDGFINSLNYQPPIHQSGCGWCYECAVDPRCDALEIKINQYLSERGIARANYFTVYHSISEQIEANFLSQCAPASSISVECQKYNPYWCCFYSFYTTTMPFIAAKITAHYVNDKNKVQFYINCNKDFLDKAMADYQAALPYLSTIQSSHIYCLIDSNDDYNTWISYLMSYDWCCARDVQFEYAALPGMLKTCLTDTYNANHQVDPVSYNHNMSNAGYGEWVATGHTVTSLEKQFCLTAFCFGYDALSGDFSFEVGAGFAGKLTYNPFSGDTAVNLGVGLKLGAGFSSAGGHVWVRMSQQEMGVEARVNLGPYEGGAFYGHENVSQ